MGCSSIPWSSSCMFGASLEECGMLLAHVRVLYHFYLIIILRSTLVYSYAMKANSLIVGQSLSVRAPSEADKPNPVEVGAGGIIIGGPITADGPLEASFLLLGKGSSGDGDDKGSYLKASEKGLEAHFILDAPTPDKNNGFATSSKDVNMFSLSASDTAGQTKGSMLDLSYSGVRHEDMSLFRASIDGQIAVDIDTTGVMSIAGINAHTGGINVRAGGIAVEAGGATIQGGLSVLSGGLHLGPKQQFTARSISATNFREENGSVDATTTSTAPLLHAHNTKSDYAGTMLELSTEAGANGEMGNGTC